MIWVRNYKPEIHHRRSIRLRSHDYSSPGYYFITLCCKNRECLFGEIVDHTMILNDFGRIVHDEWMRSATIRKEIELDEFIVMPNHFHAIVLIREEIGRGDRPENDCRGDRPVAPTETNRPVARKLPNGPKPKSIGSLIGGFKSSVTKQINSNRNKPGEPVWQRNYYERILRNEDALYITRRYILKNPRNWMQDDFNH